MTDDGINACSLGSCHSPIIAKPNSKNKSITLHKLYTIRSPLQVLSLSCQKIRAFLFKT